MPKNLNFEGLWYETGRGNTGGRGLKPHSDKTQVAIGEKVEALGQGSCWVGFGSVDYFFYYFMVPEDIKVKL